MRGPAFPGGNRYRRTSSGFTLIELIITIVLIGILAGVGATMLSDSFTTTRLVNSGAASNDQTRYAMERLAREIREVKYASSQVSPKTYCDPPTNSLTDQYCISTLNATKMVFIKTVGGTDITVTICNGTSPGCAGGTAPTPLALSYSSPAVTSNLSNQVAAFSLGYLDATDTATANVSGTAANGIQFVTITLTVTDTATSGQSTALRSRVALRNA